MYSKFQSFEKPINIQQKLHQRVQQDRQMNQILQTQKVIAYNQIKDSQQERDRRANFRKFVQEKMKQQSIITAKQRQLINQQHQNRIDRLKRERQIIQIQTNRNKQNSEISINALSRIEQQQGYKKSKLNTQVGRIRVIKKDTFQSDLPRVSFGRSQVPNGVRKQLGQQIPVSRSRAVTKDSGVMDNQRWKGKFHEAQSFEVPRQISKLSNITQINRGNYLTNQVKMGESSAGKYSRRQIFNPAVESQIINLDTPKDHLSSINKYKSPRPGSNLQTHKQAKQSEQVASNSGLKPSVLFNQQLSSNICNKWLQTDILANRSSYKLDQQRIIDEAQLRKQLELRNTERQMREQLFNDKLTSKYDRQLVAHKQYLKNMNNIDYHSSPKFQAYVPFQQYSNKKKQQDAKINQQLGSVRQVSFNVPQNKNDDAVRNSSRGRKSRRSSRSRSNYMSPTVSSNNKRRCKFDYSGSREKSQSMCKSKTKAEQKLSKLIKPVENIQHIENNKKIAKPKKVKKNKANKSFNKNRSIMPSCRNSISKYKSTTPKARSRKNSFAPYLFDQQARSTKKVAKCNFDYQAYKQLGQKKINNRLLLSQIVYQDSKFKNTKHQIDHLFNVYHNQLQMRKEIRIKVGMVPQVMKKHKFVC